MAICKEVGLIMIMSFSKLFGLFVYKNDMIRWYDTCFLFLIIWGLSGKEIKFMIKTTSFMIDRVLFKIGGKNLNLLS